MNAWLRAYECFVRRNLLATCLIVHLLVPAATTRAQEASDGTTETTAEAAERAKRLSEAQQNPEDSHPHQPDLAERERLRAQVDMLRAEIEAQQKKFDELFSQVQAQAAEHSGSQKDFGVRRRSALQQELEALLAKLESERKTTQGPNRSQQQIQQQIDTLRAELQKGDHARSERAERAPLPENAQFHVYRLQHVSAQHAAAAIKDILGDVGTRIAVDGRTNSLIIMSDEKLVPIANSIIESLDQPPSNSALKDSPAGTLQLRIVWLLDGVGGIMPNEAQLSPQVLEALKRLGLEGPAVACQQVTTLTINQDQALGQFEFSAPVWVNGRLWTLGGNGTVRPGADDHFLLDFHLKIDQYKGPSSQLSGSINTTLDHYTVLGTTTFITSDAEVRNNSGEQSPVGSPFEQTKPLKQRQHLSAFVVHLDRAQEFPAEGPTPSKE